jgi:hypothetical protein
MLHTVKYAGREPKGAGLFMTKQVQYSICRVIILVVVEGEIILLKCMRYKILLHENAAV